MPFTSLCLVLALTIAAGAATTLKDAKFDSDYDMTSEISDEIEGLEYTLRNFTFPAFDGGGGHDRVKRLLEPIGKDPAPNPLCIMTFNIRAYKGPKGSKRSKDDIIAQVSLH